MPSSMRPAEREALRQQARELRAWARQLTTEALLFRADAEVHRVRSEVARAASKELLSQLQRTVSKHAAILRKLDEPLERVIADAKQLANEATTEARLRYEHPAFVIQANVQPELVRWSTDGYLGFTP